MYMHMYTCSTKWLLVQNAWWKEWEVSFPESLTALAVHSVPSSAGGLAFFLDDGTASALTCGTSTCFCTLLNGLLSVSIPLFALASSPIYASFWPIPTITPCTEGGYRGEEGRGREKERQETESEKEREREREREKESERERERQKETKRHTQREAIPMKDRTAKTNIKITMT